MSGSPPPRIVPAGDAALLAVFGEEISLEVNARVQALAGAIEEAGVSGIRETVLGYTSLLVQYDPLALSFEDVQEMTLEAARRERAIDRGKSRVRQVPTVFGGAYGPDLLEVARHHDMGLDEVVRLFTGATFVVYMLGFSPGQPYLGGLPPELAMPRLEKPRELVPAGFVGVAIIKIGSTARTADAVSGASPRKPASEIINYR